VMTADAIGLGDCKYAPAQFHFRHPGERLIDGKTSPRKCDSFVLVPIQKATLPRCPSLDSDQSRPR
ncbi:MAG: hypothetical protein KGQ48_14780, partial [Bradyrhizobium sp.]|nr:hypothetical protein [Bradyrhizobium sp.]